MLKNESVFLLFIFISLFILFTKMNKLVKLFIFLEFFMLKLIFFFCNMIFPFSSSLLLLMLLMAACEASVNLSLVVVFVRKKKNIFSKGLFLLNKLKKLKGPWPLNSLLFF